MTDDLKNIPSKVGLEQFDVSKFSKDKIRELFRMGKVPTAEAMVERQLPDRVVAGIVEQTPLPRMR